MLTLPAWDFATPWRHFTTWLPTWLPPWFPSWLAARADHFTRWEHFTSWLYRWQTLLAGTAALLAAWIAVRWERRKERRETDAMRRSLAVEIRRSLRILYETHKVLADKAALRRDGKFPTVRDVAKMTSRVHPIVYSATADRIGRLRHPLAELVVTFYSRVKDIQFAGELAATVTNRDVTLAELYTIIDLYRWTCRNALPLLAQLPPDDSDAALRADIKAMPPLRDAPPEATTGA